MVTSFKVSTIGELPSAKDTFYALKSGLTTSISNLSLRNVCYGASILLSTMCVIHARKRQILTATALTVFTEIAMYFSTIKTENTEKGSSSSQQSELTKKTISIQPQNQVSIAATENGSLQEKNSVNPTQQAPSQEEVNVNPTQQAPSQEELSKLELITLIALTAITYIL